ncbi:MAG: hypothetical protein JW939_07495 [Candidatus Thermoplasmatota archaeon]|nr:hypothetical protein [Candidatus Thermoplasmatota archaeon]
MKSFTAGWYMLLHTRLLLHFGDPCWWPAETPFEVAVGAVLTQNTAWSNVEKAIAALKREGMMDPLKISNSSEETLAPMIHPAGYHNQKARYLKVLCGFILDELGGDITSLSGRETETAREALLGLKGIGDETADSILCYAAFRPVFVVDAYTIRIFSRMDPRCFLNRADERPPDRASVRSEVMGSLKADAGLYNRFHALLVLLAKYHCKKRPLCIGCPVRDICSTGTLTQQTNE